MIAQETLLKEISTLTLTQLQELTQYIQFLKFKSTPSEEKNVENQIVENQMDEEVTYQPKNVGSFDMTKTDIWAMSGSLKIAEPKAKYIVGRDKEGKPITNYAQHVDEILYSR